MIFIKKANEFFKIRNINYEALRNNEETLIVN